MDSISEAGIDFRSFEQQCYDMGMAFARMLMAGVLTDLGNRILKTRNRREHRAKDIRPLMIKTLMGEVTVNRRLRGALGMRMSFSIGPFSHKARAFPQWNIRRSAGTHNREDRPGETNEALLRFKALWKKEDDEETGMDALFGRLEGQPVRFIGERSGNPVFAGHIDTAVTAQPGYLTLSTVALSASKIPDYVKRSRSYQDVTMTYGDVLKLAPDDIATSDFIMRVDDKPIGIPLIQYAETGWEFAMRMVSHFNTTLTPKMESGLPVSEWVCAQRRVIRMTSPVAIPA
jgi:hypothetical protein